MMNSLTTEDMEYLAKQSSQNISLIVSEMTSLMRNTDEKIEKMESQKWYQRMVKTIFGKNKATKKEIQQNHDRLNTYMSEAVSELYRRGLIEEKIIMSLGNCINDLYAEQIQMKQMLGAFVQKLNEKITSIDNYNMLQKEIELNKYPKETPILSICSVISQYDDRILEDSRKLDILYRSLNLSGILDTAARSIESYLYEIMDISQDDVGLVYLEFENCSNHNSFIAKLFSSLIESYHFLSDSARQLKKKESIIQEVVERENIDCAASINMLSIYEELVGSKIDQIQEKDDILDRHSLYQNDEMEHINSEPIETDGKNYGESIESNNDAVGCRDLTELDDYCVEGLTIPKGGREIVSGKRVFFKEAVLCAGILAFEDCEIVFGTDLDSEDIRLEGAAIVQFGNCRITDKNIEQRRNRSAIYQKKKEATASFVKCSFENCVGTVRAGKVSFDGCYMHNCYHNFADSLDVNIKHSMHVNDSVTPEIEDCIYRNPQTGEKMNFGIDFPYYDVGNISITDSTFKNYLDDISFGFMKIYDDSKVIMERVYVFRIDALVRDDNAETIEDCRGNCDVSCRECYFDECVNPYDIKKENQSYRIHELAKELGTSSKTIVGILNDLGIEGKTASSSIDIEEKERIIKELLWGAKDSSFDECVNPYDSTPVECMDKRNQYGIEYIIIIQDDEISYSRKSKNIIVDEYGRELRIDQMMKTARDRAKYDLGLKVGEIKQIELSICLSEQICYSKIKVDRNGSSVKKPVATFSGKRASLPVIASVKNVVSLRDEEEILDEFQLYYEE